MTQVSRFPREQWLVGAVVVLHLLLAIGFSAGPIFEGPDEIEHYRYIRTLVDTRALPDPLAQVRGEYHQAPLYYLLAAPLAALLDDGDFPQIDGRLNPYYGAMIHVPGNDNKNIYLHTRAEQFPNSNSPTARAVHVLRLIAVILSTGTVIVSERFFRLLWPDRPARRLLALGIVAFWPQFLYLSGLISNDNLLIFLATLSLWLAVRQLRDGPTRRGAVLLGAVAGAMLITKVSAVFAGIPIGLVFALDRRAWRFVPLAAGATALVAGWWFAANTIRYHDPALTDATLTTWSSEVIRPGELALDIARDRLPFAYETAWARFGQGAVAVAQPVYTLFDALVIVSLAGLGLQALRAGWAARRRGIEWRGVRLAVVVAVFALAWAGVTVYWAATAWSGNQGRYVLPGIAAWAALMAYGLDAWIPRRIAPVIAIGGVAALALVAAISLFGYFLPAYRVSSVPDTIAVPLDYTYEGVAELTGFSPASPTARPGDTITLTLIWRALRPADTQLQTYLHSVDTNTVRRDSLPGTGNLLATDWRAGETWAEHYTIKIPPDAPQQMVDLLVAGLYDPAAGRTLTALDASGQPVTPAVGRIAINGDPQPADPVTFFGSSIGLETPRLTVESGHATVCLRWVALHRPDYDYTIFVHVVAHDGSPLAALDVPPKGGNYPTHVWARGEVIADCITFDVPPSAAGWRVALGLYRPDTLERLPARDAAGHALPDDSVVLAP